jgi:DNA primase
MYLLGRDFDPDQIERDYQIVGTGPLGDYKHRIIVPIYRQGQLISYMGRDVTGRVKKRYKNCPGEQQVFPAKSWLYGLDRCWDRDRVLVVEGPTDVWRMGIGAVATMGINWTWEQAALLAGFKTVFLLFDPEDQAQEQARKLTEVLVLGGVDTEVVQLNAGEQDPGSLSRDRVLYLRRWLGL